MVMGRYLVNRYASFVMPAVRKWDNGHHESVITQQAQLAE